MDEEAEVDLAESVKKKKKKKKKRSTDTRIQAGLHLSSLIQVQRIRTLQPFFSSVHKIAVLGAK